MAEKTHKIDSQNSDTPAPSGKELYILDTPSYFDGLKIMYSVYKAIIWSRVTLGFTAAPT
jgi:hypothetical protein